MQDMNIFYKTRIKSDIRFFEKKIIVIKYMFELTKSNKRLKKEEIIEKNNFLCVISRLNWLSHNVLVSSLSLKNYIV